MLEIGPMYPFAGSEVLMWIIGMGFFIWWCVWQAKTEDKHFQEDADYIKQHSLSSDASQGDETIK